MSLSLICCGDFHCQDQDFFSRALRRSIKGLTSDYLPWYGVISTGCPAASLTHFIVILNALNNLQLGEKTGFFAIL
jgi:hypothetical protein